VVGIKKEKESTRSYTSKNISSNFRLIHTGCTLNVSRDLRSLISYDQEGGTFILQHPISIHTSSIHSK
jgi:hypothetical protein